MDGGFEAERGQAVSTTGLAIPDYLSKTYTWAYLTPASLYLLDNPVVMTAILWGNLPRLVRAAGEEFRAGQHIFQAASAYGHLSAHLAEVVGPEGRLEVIDIAPLQVEHCRNKLADFPQAHVRRADAAVLDGSSYDGVCCFFLLHEVPDDYKSAIVNGLLARVPEGGKAVFVDYHRPGVWHPLRGIMYLVFRYLEPYAFSLIESEIRNFASEPEAFTWQKDVIFGGLYQKVVAVRKPV